MTGAPPAGAPPLQLAIAAVVAQARQPQLGRLASLATPQSVARLSEHTAGTGTPGRLPMTPGTVLGRFAGKVLQVEYAGGRAAVAVQAGSLAVGSWFYFRQGRWLLDLADTRPLVPAWEGPDHPENHAVALQQAWTETGTGGPLVATLHTTDGEIHCLLHEQQVPDIVANFVGLATGARASRLAQGRTLTTTWQHKPYYDGTTLHRAVPGKRVEGGDPFGLGTGQAGYRLRDHFDLSLRHDKPGVLGLATLGPHSASSIFYIALQPDPELDDRGVIFGLCRELDVLDRWSRRPPGSVTVTSVSIGRGFPASTGPNHADGAPAEPPTVVPPTATPTTKPL